MENKLPNKRPSIWNIIEQNKLKLGPLPNNSTMNRTLLLLLFSSLLFVACKDTEKSLTPLDIANTYYEALSNSNGEALKPLLSDTLYTKELDYDYEETFSKKQYLENWLKWDAMFDPTYEVLEIKQENQ